MEGRESEATRVAWVDYAKGICIVAVVGFYSTWHVEGALGDRGWMGYWVDFARPFRMPDFFLVSGLFLSRVIDRPWRGYFDKKILHYAYFFAVWTTLYFAVIAWETRPAIDRHLLAEYLAWYGEPYHQLWFIAMLPWYFLVTRLVRRVPWLIVLPLAALLQVLHPETGLRQLDRFGERYVYFYAGYAFAPLVFSLAAWAQRFPRRALLGLLGWAVVNESIVLAGLSERPGYSLVLGFAGAAAVMTIASLLTRWPATDWLRYLGQNSIVIFLAFFLFMVAAARSIWRFDLIADAGTQAFVISVVAVFASVVLFWAVRKTPARFLFERPSWARLRDHPSDARASSPAKISGTV